MNAMKTEQVRQVRKAALAVGVGAALVGGVLLFVPDQGPVPPPSPEARAMIAVGAGAPAAVPDLTALISNRETWLRTHPEDDQSWSVLGAAYVERGMSGADSASYPKADQALQRSLAVRPAERGNLMALVGLGSLANARNDFAAAKKWGETVRNQEPAQWMAYPVLIDAYSGLGDYKAAAKALDKLKELRSDGPVLERSAQVYRARGWREDAMAKATEAVAGAGAPTEKAEALSMLGELAWDRGEPQEALGHYDAALAAASGHYASRAGRARALAALGRTEEAYRDYQTALEKLPEPEYALELGELYDSLGLSGDAQSQYATVLARAREAQGDGVDEDLVLARYETAHGDPQAAVARLRTEWEQRHRSMEVADALGWALYEAGEDDEALKYAKRATEQGQGRALFLYHRGEIERSLGMDGSARRHIGEALRLNPSFSPLLAPRAREALNELGEMPEGGPENMYGDGEEEEVELVPARKPAPGRSGAPSRKAESATPTPTTPGLHAPVGTVAPAKPSPATYGRG
ncbi:tetratricopeptide repeat protein [Streptomyces sp. NPDC058405]|uniref:tetratricopeptide repeat protein n=1 Tax=unclassified Streptomyces TaxID=2593676 RepID=UPI0036694082